MLRIAGVGRVTGPAVMFRPNLSVAYRCYDARSYDPISVSRYVSLVEAAYGVGPGENLLISMGGDPNPLLERLTSTRCRWTKDSSGHVGVALVQQSLPRAYVAAGVLPRDGGTALDTVLTLRDPWRRTVIEANAAAGPPSERLVPAEVTAYSPHRVTVHATTDRPGWLVLTDTCFPGWRASVNGHEVAIAPANYAFRSVPVGAGESVVAFSYEPASYRIGLFVSCLSLCVCCGLVGGNLAGGRRRRG